MRWPACGSPLASLASPRRVLLVIILLSVRLMHEMLVLAAVSEPRDLALDRQPACLGREPALQALVAGTAATAGRGPIRSLVLVFAAAITLIPPQYVASPCRRRGAMIGLILSVFCVAIAAAAAVVSFPVVVCGALRLRRAVARLVLWRACLAAAMQPGLLAAIRCGFMHGGHIATSATGR